MSDPKRTENSQGTETPSTRAKKLLGYVISGRYRVDDILAFGGMGVVYRGQHVHMRKRVAIKVLLPETRDLPNLVARFEREAIAGAHISHPNIASATDFGKLDDGSYFLIQEYVRGITLNDLIKRGPVPTRRALRIARQLAAALGAAHQMGIIHRDLKPRNVMVDEERGDFVKLIDFGLSKVPVDQLTTRDESEDDESQRDLTTVGVVFGTVAYMSPEAAFGMNVVDPRSDLYALGLILYEMLAGAHPIDAKDPVEVFRQQRMVMPSPIGVRSPGVEVPPDVEAVVMKLLQKEPDARFETADVLIEALDDAMPGIDIPAERISGQTSVSQPPASVRPGNTTLSPASTRSPTSARSLEIKMPGGTGPIGVTAQAAGNAPTSPGASALQGSASTSSPPASTSTPALSRSAEVKTPALSTTSSVTRTRNLTAASYVPVVQVRNRSVWRSRGAGWIGGLAAAALVVGGALFLLRGKTFSAEGRSAPIATEAATGAAAREDGVPTTPLPETAAPAPSPAAPPVALTGPAALRQKVRDSADTKIWKEGADALLELSKVDPSAFNTPEMRAAAASIAVGITADPERARQVFQVLSTGVGSAGIDVLYEIALQPGSTDASRRAAELLARREIAERGTPALRVALDLHNATCMKKALHFKRAQVDGDERAVAELELLRARTCNKRRGDCCFQNNVIVDDTIDAIKTRIGSKTP